MQARGGDVIDRLRALFWRVQRPVVDRARTLVAVVRRPPPTLAGGRGPLGSPHADTVLALLADQPLMQPDRTSCGSSSLTLLRMLRHPAYARVVSAADDPQRVFGVGALGVRRRTNALLDASGRLQLRWPAALGVRPAAMVRLMDADDAFGAGAGAARYRTVDVDPAAPDRAYDAAAAQVRAGEPVPLYVGNGHWMQHIVLVVGAETDALIAYDPACGALVRVPRADFVSDRLDVAGWSRPWLLVLRASRRARPCRRSRDSP